MFFSSNAVSRLLRRYGLRLNAPSLVQLVSAVLNRIPFRPVQVGWFWTLDTPVSTRTQKTSQTKVRVRPATPEDLPSIIECGGGRASMADLSTRFVAGDYCAVAEVDNQVAGYEWFCCSPIHVEGRFNYVIEIPEDSVYGYDCFVDSRYRLMGVWLLLQVHLSEFARSCGRSRVIAIVDCANELSFRTHLQYGFRPYQKAFVLRVFEHPFSSVREVAEWDVKVPVGARSQMNRATQ